MGPREESERKPFEDICCGAYCSEAGCCPFNYYPKDHLEDRDPDTNDLFPNEYKRPGNPDVDVG